MSKENSKEENLWTQLCKFQGEVRALERTSKVKFESRNGGRREYDYVDLGSALDVVLPLLSKHGLALTTRSVYDRIEKTVVTNTDGKQVTEKTLVKIIYGIEASLTHAESGEVIAEQFFHDQQVQDIKDRGSLITYMRRYAIMTLLCLSAKGEDDDNNGGAPKGHQQPPAASQPAPAGQGKPEAKGTAQSPSKTATEATKAVEDKKAAQAATKKQFEGYKFTDAQLEVLHRANLTSMQQVITKREAYETNEAMISDMTGQAPEGGAQ